MADKASDSEDDTQLILGKYKSLEEVPREVSVSSNNLDEVCRFIVGWLDKGGAWQATGQGAQEEPLEVHRQTDLHSGVATHLGYGVAALPGVWIDNPQPPCLQVPFVLVQEWIRSMKKNICFCQSNIIIAVFRLSYALVARDLYLL